MNGKKLFYIFKDPMGSKDCKIGITSNPIVRLGVYQNSYSRKSHIARFDLVYIGSNRIISNLEKAVKNEFSWDIELDGRGHSEWISKPYEMLESQIDKIINGYNFKVKKVPKNLLPLTIYNLEQIIQDLDT